MFRDTDLFWTMRWMRADAVAIFIAAVGATMVTHGRWWWFFALFLVPDLSMTGYLFGSRAGAVAYNTAHMYAWPLVLLATGLASHASFSTTAALSWIAHIALDQAVGYGLKFTDGIRAHSTWAHWTNAPKSRCGRPLFCCSSRMIEAGIDNSHLALCQNCVRCRSELQANSMIYGRS